MGFDGLPPEFPDWAAQPKQITSSSRKERRIRVTKNRLNITGLSIDYLIGGTGRGRSVAA